MRSGGDCDYEKCERIAGDCAAWFDSESGRRSADHQSGLSAHDHNLAAARAQRRHCPETDYVSCTAAEPRLSGETHRGKYYAAHQSDSYLPYHKSHGTDFSGEADLPDGTGARD